MKPAKIIIVTVLLIVLDQISKYFFYNQNIGSHLPFITKALNTGISFSVSLALPIIITFSLIALIAFVHLLRKKIISPLVFCLLFAGTIGNLTDRMFLGGVRDFIQIGAFPIFNIADTLLNLGLILFFRGELKKSSWKRN